MTVVALIFALVADLLVFGGLVVFAVRDRDRVQDVGHHMTTSFDQGYRAGFVQGAQLERNGLEAFERKVRAKAQRENSLDLLLVADELAERLAEGYPS